MDPDGEDNRTAFAAALTQARSSTKITQTEIAERLGVTQSAVSGWHQGRWVPEKPATVFALEQLLGCLPGALSHHLGYVPTEAVSDVPTAVYADKRLTDHARRALLGVYEQFVNGESGAPA